MNNIPTTQYEIPSSGIGKVLIGSAVGIVCGFFLGREHLKYEMRSAVQSVFRGIAPEASEKRGIEAVNYANEFLRLDNFKLKGNAKGVIATGRIKNTGNRTLTTLTGTLYFLDDANQPVADHEERVVTLFSFSRDTSPLRPNYERELSISAVPPKGWAEGHAKLRWTEATLE